MTAFVLTLVASALAVGLELLEAAAIVLAVASVRRPRDAVVGAVAAMVLLAVLAVAVGPLALEALPRDVLQLVIGAALLLFGLEWLRKGVLRLAGRRRPSSALAEYLEEREVLEALPPARAGRPDWAARVIAGKGVLLEGVEVVLIVAALGSGDQGALPAVLGAGLAALAVCAVAVVLHRPLARLPESHLKYGVGVALTAFGVFFVAEGSGARWPGDDAALLVVAAALVAVSLLLVRVLAGGRPRAAPVTSS